VLGFAEENGLIRSNPATNQRLSTAQSKKEIVFLTPEQIEKLARAVEHPGDPGTRTYPEYALLVRFAAYTGLRAGEICGLQVGDLDLTAGTVKVALVLGHLRADVRDNFPVLEYGGRTYPDRFIDSTKTDRIRMVPVPAALVAAALAR
jgi:integrase